MTALMQRKRYGAFKSTSFPGMFMQNLILHILQTEWLRKRKQRMCGEFCKQRQLYAVENLKTSLQEEWDKITPETLHSLVSIVPEHLFSVVRRTSILLVVRALMFLLLLDCVARLKCHFFSYIYIYLIKWSWWDKTWKVMGSFCLNSLTIRPK